ncbi:SDR family oxidoreductase [Aggregicoccus sp. 17bor-14]|uniref:SDR family NAD(P)-dependent oxidoreductase n=1 Tax=Myxococcaceae TaxID=31 RepID=UPI00129C150A|nr:MULTISPECIES: SDR family oxidoreductase [Myxococcaceae]MBF5041930.1 SDR family oxidoreductase [Simulacricoccus sp. 17bor-14]MRI87711.1 SDR family oxidoreductase [Aggregicoccus sp. 17bor-14]
MDLQLQDKKALVTGSTAGIGLAIATALAREGAQVVLNGRTPARVEAALAAVRKVVPGAKLSGVAADLGTAEGARQVVAQVPRVDVLVNNLGIFASKPFEEIPDEEWLQFFETNVLSGVRLSRAYLPGMREQNWGRILFVSSESAVHIPSEMIHYGMTKTAQVAVSRGLAETTVGTGVTVNTVLPGPTASEGVEGFVEGLAKQQGVSRAQVEKEFFQKMRPSSLLKRFIDPSEVASLVAYLASPLSAATNGAALRVDGGLLRSVL